MRQPFAYCLHKHAYSQPLLFGFAIRRLHKFPGTVSRLTGVLGNVPIMSSHSRKIDVLSGPAPLLHIGWSLHDAGPQLSV